MNGLQNAINSQAAPPTDAGAGLTEAQRLELFGKLNPAGLDLMEQIVTKLSDNAADLTEIEKWAWSEVKKLSTTPTTEPEPEFEAVGTIARHVVAKLLLGEFGVQIFDIQNGFSALENVYLDVVESIESALPHCDRDELSTAAFELSFKG